MATHALQCATIDFQSLPITGPSWIQRVPENVHKAEDAVCVCAAEGGVTVMLILQPACSNCLAFFFFFHPLKCMCLSEKWSFELLPQFWPVRHPVALARHVLDSQPRSLMLYVLSALHHLLCSVLEMLFVGCSFSSCWRGVRLWQTAALWKDLMGINSSKVRHLEFTCSQIKMLFHAHTFPHM